MIKVPLQVGVSHIETLITSLFQNLRLDRNHDGKISKSEWISGVMGLLPSLFDYEDLSAEVRDLTKSEIKGLIAYVGKNFPDYDGVAQEKEDLVRELVALIAQVYQVILSVKRVQDANNPEKVAELAAAETAQGLPEIDPSIDLNL